MIYTFSSKWKILSSVLRLNYMITSSFFILSQSIFIIFYKMLI